MGLSSLDNWRGVLINGLVSYDPNSIWDCLVHGLAYFIPLYITVFLAGIFFEIWFASKRGHEVNEGYLLLQFCSPDLATIHSFVDGGRGCSVWRGHR